MQQQFIDLVSKINQLSIDTTKELMAINSRTFEKFSNKQIQMINDCVAVNVNQLDSASKIKDIKDIPEFINTQVTEMQKLAENYYSTAKETMEMLAETTEEANALMKKGMDAAASNLKTAPRKKAA